MLLEFIYFTNLYLGGILKVREKLSQSTKQLMLSSSGLISLYTWY